ncbi:hypothetical protein GYMLUDRAFT_64080 [Collybiopsis luxurians FD-317 M1]|uniref:Uncharacterized protein n=1 Tax=Collybiopsis luxurians FD-317 M1 TaxID=944289 RepID=A0A0D0AQU9_9AGAR|nr:hypothetical protein GYMLUDRAFT_64080 [Collybiopsis luxurians FD-317 M1]
MAVAIPLQNITDKGSEVGWIEALQIALRELLASQIDPETFPPYVAVKSTHNTVIEAIWHWFREKKGKDIKDYLMQGKNEHLFNPNEPFHCDLFYWIFVPLVQNELDDF